MTIDLDEAERRGNAATAAPWDFGQAPEETLPTMLIGSGSLLFARVVCRTISEAVSKARFIVYARNNWQAIIDRIRELEADRIKWMSISYAVEEWMGGRITDDELREHATKVLDELAAENKVSNER